ncbi:5503_t:CDS:2 [Acaulospora morrowiae]|uniref:5503_t:CDS:1 n=1 Tax=Acaulospora morrowiae TaxID=94023 RepID=A0A9N8W1J5_9GLOM|nr:5503_t:CDS:2 [Acaulospora morrowiae]
MCQSYRQMENPQNRITAKEMGLKWKSMSARDRKPYVDSSIRKKEQFKLENPNVKRKRKRSVRRKNLKFVNNSPETIQLEQTKKECMKL